jgi:hypothetical protein
MRVPLYGLYVLVVVVCFCALINGTFAYASMVANSLVPTQPTVSTIGVTAGR